MTVTPMTVEDGEGAQKGMTTTNLWLFTILAGVLNWVFWVSALVASSLGGRLDVGSDGEPVERPQNFLAPMPYAFIIWPVIYLTEFIFLIWQSWGQWLPALFGYVNEERLAAIRSLAPGWCLGNLSQFIWCFTYTPWFAERGLIWISAFNLAGVAVGLSFAHQVLAARDSWVDLVLMYLPVTLHLGWTTAASLVNVNTWMASTFSSVALKVAVSNACLLAAAAIVVPLSIYRKSVLFAGVVFLWAVVAVGVATLAAGDMPKEIGDTGALVQGIVQVSWGIGMFLVVLAFNVQGLFKASPEEGAHLVEETA